MAAEQLSNGPDGPGPTRRRVLVALATAALVVVAVLALREGRPRSPEPPPVAVPTRPVPTRPVPIESPPPVDPSAGPVPALRVDAVCPARTDHRTTLAVSFTLLNGTAEPVTLESVKPYFPLPGLRPRSTSVGVGTCASPGPPHPGRTVFPGEAVIVTLRFGLPASCPQALPVQAEVRERTADGRKRTSREPLFADLGAVDFDSCPDA